MTALRRMRPWPEAAILLTGAMTCTGLDAAEVAVVASLTHIRSRPWLKQMMVRATRWPRMRGSGSRSAPWCCTLPPRAFQERFGIGGWLGVAEDERWHAGLRLGHGAWGGRKKALATPP